MHTVTATEFRQNLFHYLAEVEHGGCVHIQIRGRVVARLEPVVDAAEAARERLHAIASEIIVGDVLNSANDDWTGDAEHL
ncbi:prevent-host-death family protein [Paraperlucidibaca baekdonensis]|uniref:Prevent-host-death family protein n=1 Tax=Paraperlucidibaca baekdonensis TaxID=748120 RepID=A0A3E0H9T9_9GAMM|nr:type II toxin-antitoxin system prevent-host-death family antitoxin [Paraperlucidibaca baekdonensis]REH40393.1 prevent-host-death family protein [Paraperlucidibaca baekdonensis]